MIASNQELEKWLLETPLQNQNILEVACGGGWVSRYLAKHNTPKSYLGIDFAPSAVKNALTLNANNNFDFKEADALDSTLYEKNYDFIMAHQFLHCLIGKDRTKWLQLCHQSLKESGGHLFISSMVTIPKSLAGTIDPETKTNKPRNRYYADENEIEEELKAVNFKIIKQAKPEQYVNFYLAKACV